MVKVTDIDEDIIFLSSIRNKFTYMEQGARGNVFKNYRPTKKRKASLDTFFGLIEANSRSEWNDLSQAQKDIWNK